MNKDLSAAPYAAIINAINKGDLTYEANLIPCEKCSHIVTEYKVYITVYVNFMVRIPIKTSFRVMYDPTCGLSYLRF